MARKWKQINKFIEIFASNKLMQSKKNYASSILVQGFNFCFVWLFTGTTKDSFSVELRRNLVEFCQNVADKLIIWTFLKAMFVVISQKNYDCFACVWYRDWFCHSYRLNASMIMCAPCCHKELRYIVLKFYNRCYSLVFMLGWDVDRYITCVTFKSVWL